MRLPVLGGAGSPGAPSGEAVVAPPVIAHVRVPRPTVCVIGAAPTVSGAALARALGSAFTASGLRVGSLAEVGSAPSLAELYAPFADADVVIARGSELLALAAPTLTVMLTGGLLPPSWSREARALRPRVDITLADAREAFVRELATGWTRALGDRSTRP